MNKIFQIGFNKCATHSIHELFSKYTKPALKSVHWDFGKLAKTIKFNLENKQPALKGYESFNVFTDMECEFKIDKQSKPDWFFAYKQFKEFDRQYPNSKFILNTRDVKNWIRSRLEHKTISTIVGDQVVSEQPYSPYYKSHMKIYNLESIGDLIKLWENDWYEHHYAVTDYFKNRPDDLLIFNCETDSLEKIKTFFSDIAFFTDIFPKENKTQYSF